ncbi:MAG: NAD+ kinase [Candidatus Poriferisodalaceae bacterium]
MSTLVFSLRSESLEAVALCNRVIKGLLLKGHQVQMLPEEADALALPDVATDISLIGVNADLAVSVGGDGTMLRTFDLVAGKNVPVLGVNMGRLGYLTEFEPDQIDTAITSALSGALPIEQRMMVAGRLIRSDGSENGLWLGLNEVIVEKRDQGHTVRLEVMLDGNHFATYAADGLIVSTPTGSTAYNLSARGAVVAPTHLSLQLTPVAPHMLFDRSLILVPETEIRICVAGNRAANLSVDGRNVASLDEGDTIVVTQAMTFALLVTSGGGGFHQVLKQKFGLKDS